MNHKMKDMVRKYHMIQPGDRVYVALSGGADSVALLHLLKGMEAEWEISVKALHFNHRLRGGESDRDQAFVVSLCKKLQVPLTVGTAPVKRLAKQYKLSVEDCARRVRYAFFRRHAAGEGTKVATAHTASDNAETVVLNLVRGTGIKGLGGIPPSRENIIRPLLGCSREEIEAYCKKYRLQYVTDSSNLSDDYTRNRIRHNVIPQLVAENPRFIQRTAEMAGQIRFDARCLDDMALAALEKLKTRRGFYDRIGYRSLHEALRPRVLRLLLQEKNLPVSRDRLQLMDSLLEQGSGGTQLSRQWAFKVSENFFTLIPFRRKQKHKATEISQIVQIAVPGVGESVQASLPDRRKIDISFTKPENYEKIIKLAKKALKNTMDYGKIEKILSLRYARPSDRIRLPGRGCTKTLKNLWSEAGVKPGDRKHTLLLEASGRTVWVEGFGVGEQYRADGNTKAALEIKIVEDE